MTAWPRVIAHADMDAFYAAIEQLDDPTLRGKPIPPDPTLAEERALLLHHYDLICQRFGPEKGTILMRKYACCYAQGCPGARAFRSCVARVSTPGEFHAAVEQHFPRDS